jgi:microcystin-dependent protein
MAQPFIGEIRMFGGNFAPNGWAFCSGQLMPISENAALFQLIGTTYGGDGVQTFALPNLQSRFPMHQGTNPQSGVTVVIGERSGTETVTLTVNQLPAHAHPAICSSGGGDSETPVHNFWATDPMGNTAAYTTAFDSQINQSAIGTTGGSQPHDNMKPFLVINFIISLFGIFPTQT